MSLNLPHGWQLPESIASRLGESSGRQRAIVEEGHLLLVLHKLPSAEGAKREGVFFWRQPQGQWKCSDGREGAVALRGHLESYLKALEQLDDAYEKADTASEYFAVLEAVVPMYRSSKNQLAALQAAREAIPQAREIITFRDMAGDIERAADLIHADAKNALDYKIARQGEEQSRISNELSEAGHRLNLLAALFLPMSVIGGAFGSSLKNGLEDSPTWVFWALMAGALLLGFALRGKAKR
jgi:Mg2+ and Co2+ transporter CorA